MVAFQHVQSQNTCLKKKGEMKELIGINLTT